MSEKRSFSPADLQKDLKNFLEEKYGNQVVFQEGEAAGMQEGPSCGRTRRANHRF